MRSGIGSWRRPENSAGFVVRQGCEKNEGPCSPLADEMDNFRVTDDLIGIQRPRLRRARYTSRPSAVTSRRLGTDGDTHPYRNDAN